MKDAARPLSSSSSRYHAVRFYESDRSLAQIVADFLGEGLARNHPALVIATAAQRAAIVRQLVVKSFDVVHLQRAGDLVLLDAQETLGAFMVDGKADETEFKDVMCEVIKNACQGRANCTVRVYGQMVDVLWKDGQRDAAIRLEMLWNQLTAPEEFSLLCGYAIGNFYKDVKFDDVCRQHTHIVAADGSSDKVA
jgi:hypothetical protein